MRVGGGVGCGVGVLGVGVGGRPGGGGGASLAKACSNTAPEGLITRAAENKSRST